VLFTFRSVAGESSFARRPSSALHGAIKSRAYSIAYTPAIGIGIYPLLDTVDETVTRIGRVQSKSRRIIPLPGAACYSIVLVVALPAPGVASPQVSPYPSVFGRAYTDRVLDVPSSLADVPPVDCGRTRLPFHECRAGSVKGKPSLPNRVPARRAIVVPTPHERHPLGLRVARSRVQRPIPASPSPINILPVELVGQGCTPPPSARVAPSTTRYRTPSHTKSPQHRTKHYTTPYTPTQTC
jgi:hypothetical protein